MDSVQTSETSRRQDPLPSIDEWMSSLDFESTDSIPIPTRSSAGRGIKPTGADFVYSVNTADLDDVRCEIWKLTKNGDGAAPTAAVLFGDADADYDSAHDTAAKRGDSTAGPELHQATITDAGAPAYVGAGETLKARIYCDGDAGAAGVLAVQSISLRFSEMQLDR